MVSPSGGRGDFFPANRQKDGGTHGTKKADENQSRARGIGRRRDDWCAQRLWWRSPPSYGGYGGRSSSPPISIPDTDCYTDTVTDTDTDADPDTSAVIGLVDRQQSQPRSVRQPAQFASSHLGQRRLGSWHCRRKHPCRALER